MEGFLTTEEAAELLGVAPKTLYYYLRDHEKNGFPKPRRFGRALMWEREPLLAWRREHPARKRREQD
jgi:excisionase family DNA binding protein